MVICKVPNCLFDANIECSCSLKYCKLHYKKHSSENFDDHQGHKIFHNVDEHSKKEILNFLYEVKRKVSQWASQTKLHWVKKHTKIQLMDFSSLFKRFHEIIINCDELILKIIKISKLPVKICYDPIEYFLMQPLEKTLKYTSALNLNISEFSLEIIPEILAETQNHLYNYNYLDGNEKDFHGGEIQKEKELIMELLNIAGSLLNDDEYYNSKCLYKHCRKILEKIQYHKQIDVFFIDYYLFMIQHKIDPNCGKDEPVPKPKIFICPYFIDFLDFMTSTYVNWGQEHKPKEFLKNTMQISKKEFTSEDHYDGWLCFCKGLINLYINNFEKSDIYFRTSKIYFKAPDQFLFLALMYYYLGFLHSTRLRTDVGIYYIKKCKSICKKHNLLLLLEKAYFGLGYLLIYQFRLEKGEKYLKKGKKMLNGPGKRYDVAFFKLSIFKTDLEESYELLKKINGGFYVLPIQNRILGWLYSEVGFLYFLFGDVKQAESYFSRINLDVIKASDLYNLINVCVLLVIFYIFTSRFQKAEEVLNILAEKYEHFVGDLKFFIDMGRLTLRIFSGNCLMKSDQEFEGIKNEIQTLSLPPCYSENTEKFFQVFQKTCNESKFWDDLLEKLFNHIISDFPHRNPLFAYIYQLKSKLEENLGNHEEARECLFKSLEILKKFVSPNNVQVKNTEQKIIEIGKAIKPHNKKQICF